MVSKDQYYDAFSGDYYVESTNVLRADHSRNGDESSWKSSHGTPSLRLINFNTVAMNIEYSCLMPTVYDYAMSLGGSKHFYGWLLACFSITRMLVFIPVGYWADYRPFKEVFVTTSCVGFIGCMIYGVAGHIGNKWLLVLGRVLTGFGASNTTLSRTYIAKVCEADEFTKILGVQLTLDLLGVMVGPALIACTSRIDYKYGWFEFNEKTAPGYIMAVLQLVMAFNFLTVFVEPPDDKSKTKLTIRRKDLQMDDGENAQYKLLDDEREISEVTNKSMEEGNVSSEKTVNVLCFKFPAAVKRVLIDGGGWFFLLTVFTVNFNLCALETVATPLMEENYHWHSIENSSFFAGCAAVGVIGMWTGMKLEKSFNNGRVPMVVGLSSMALAFVIWLSFDGGKSLPKAGFFAGAFFCIFGLCCVTPPNSSFFTKIVEWQGGQQGLFGGVWSVIMSAGKSVGPIVAGGALDYMDKGHNGHWIIFVLCVPVLITNIVLFPCIWGVTKEVDKCVEDLEVSRCGDSRDDSTPLEREDAEYSMRESGLHLSVGIGLDDSNASLNESLLRDVLDDNNSRSGKEQVGEENSDQERLTLQERISRHVHWDTQFG